MAAHKKILSVMAIASAALVSICVLYAQDSVKADRIVDIGKSRVSYDIKTLEGEELVLTADYASTRPNPEIENMDIDPKSSISEGTKVFRLLTKEGTPIVILYTYAGGDLVGIKISAEPSDPSSNVEYPQTLSVESKGGHIINFTFIWQGEDLKEVRIEPLINPFS